MLRSIPISVAGGCPWDKCSNKVQKFASSDKRNYILNEMEKYVLLQKLLILLKAYLSYMI